MQVMIFETGAAVHTKAVDAENHSRDVGVAHNHRISRISSIYTMRIEEMMQLRLIGKLSLLLLIGKLLLLLLIRKLPPPFLTIFCCCRICCYCCSVPQPFKPEVPAPEP